MLPFSDTTCKRYVQSVTMGTAMGSEPGGLGFWRLVDLSTIVYDLLGTITGGTTREHGRQLWASSVVKSSSTRYLATELMRFTMREVCH